MTDLYHEVSELANGLYNSFEAFRQQAMRRRSLYAMRKDPIVPEEIAREGAVHVTSGLVMHAAQSIRSDIMMNPTEFMVIPLARERDGAITTPMERKAENLERALAVIWGKLNEGRRIDREIIWHQLVTGFGVMVLEFEELMIPDQPEWMSDQAYADLVDTYERDWIPWKICTPEPLTCGWLERDGQPVIFARRYRMLVRDVEELYSKRPGSVEPEANLRLTDHGWQWVGDDYSWEQSRVFAAGLREVNVTWLDDGRHIYHLVDSPHGSGGCVVWAAPNPIGRCTAFIVPGNITPDRRPELRYEPFLLPLMQAVSDINNIRSMRATAARNMAGPHMYIPIDPEIQKQYLARGEKLPLAHRWRKNEIAYLLGEIKTAPSEVSPDWDRVEQAINEDMQRFLPSPFVHIVDPAVLKAATATSILHAAEAGLRLYGPLMSAYDAAIRDICDFGIVGSILRQYDDLRLMAFATGEEMARGRNLRQGTAYHLSREAVNFPHKILVKTRGMSQAQAAAQYDLALRQWVLPDGTKGPATLDDLIDAANYTDKVSQKMKLAEESILRAVDPWLQQMAIETIRRQVELDSGIQLPIVPTQPSEPQPARLPSAAQRMDAPLVTGPEGGSGEVVG